MSECDYNFLRFIPYTKLLCWSIRQTTRISSDKFPLRCLSDLICEKKDKYDISNPEENYGILGVNNQTGIFDAYIENGAKIKQKYKKMERGWIAYNPYRINVGSVGVKNDGHRYDYISPAYVVFSCQPNLSPDFLYLSMKTDTFNKLIRESTTGSVRQTLSFNNLASINLPLPSIEDQQRIVSEYKIKIQQAEALEKEAQQISEDIEKYLAMTLGMVESSYNLIFHNEYTHFSFIKYKDLNVWGTELLFTSQKRTNYKYPLLKIRDICSLGSGGTPSRSRSEYYKGNIPWIKTGEVVNEEILDTEEHITEEAIADSSAKLYPKGSIIIAMYGQGDTRGRTAKLGVDATTNQACAVLYNIDTDIICTDYLWYYLQSRYHDMRSLASGNNQPNLNAGKINNYNIVVPPKEVQEEIVTYIMNQKNKAKELSSRADDIKKEALKHFEYEIFEK